MDHNDLGIDRQFSELIILHKIVECGSEPLSVRRSTYRDTAENSCGQEIGMNVELDMGTCATGAKGVHCLPSCNRANMTITHPLLLLHPCSFSFALVFSALCLYVRLEKRTLKSALHDDLEQCFCV